MSNDHHRNPLIAACERAALEAQRLNTSLETAARAVVRYERQRAAAAKRALWRFLALLASVALFSTCLALWWRANS